MSKFVRNLTAAGESAARGHAVVSRAAESGSAGPAGQTVAAPENPQPNLQALTVPLQMWPALLLTGVGAGLTSGLLMKLLRLVQHTCFDYRQGSFLSGVEGVTATHRVLVMTGAGIIAGIVLLLMRLLPDHNGPGLNEAIWKHEGRLPQTKTVLSALLSIVIVGMGAALGRETALKEAGGLAGLKVWDWSGRWLKFTPEQRRLLVACGTGAGMAAAYNVPFGGALFTLEVLLGSISLATALPAFATAFIATAVSWLMLPNEPTYQLPTLPATASLLWWALICGPLMGFASVWFVRGVHWAKDNKPEHLAIVALPVIVFALLGGSAVPFPQLLGNGKNVVQLMFDSNPGIPLLLWLVLLRPLATILCLRAGAPGGLFTPTMTLGALLGGELGEGWAHFFSGTDERSCALLGAGAVLGAATQAPVSSVAFTLEFTYNANTLMVPLLLAMGGAALTYRLFETRTTY